MRFEQCKREKRERERKRTYKWCIYVIKAHRVISFQHTECFICVPCVMMICTTLIYVHIHTRMHAHIYQPIQSQTRIGGGPTDNSDKVLFHVDLSL